MLSCFFFLKMCLFIWKKEIEKVYHMLVHSLSGYNIWSLLIWKTRAWSFSQVSQLGSGFQRTVSWLFQAISRELHWKWRSRDSEQHCCASGLALECWLWMKHHFIAIGEDFYNQVLLNLLRTVLWTRICPTWKCCMCTWERCVLRYFGVESSIYAFILLSLLAAILHL